MKSLSVKNVLLFCFLITLIISCKSDKKEVDSKTEKVKSEGNIVEMPSNVINIITKSMDFTTKDTITSGWNTFKYQNLSYETHFFLMDKYPEGKNVEHTLKEVAPVFEEGMQLINEGRREEGFAAFGKLPEWFGDIVFSGGSGLVGPRETAMTCINLEPGYYIMECYVKMPNGKFHTSMGMAKPIIVTTEDSGNSPPEATINITVSNDEGITYDKPMTKGKHVFSVFYKEQRHHENFMQHDVNLVKLKDYASIEALEKWMDWSDPKGLITPVPNGVTFLGGVNEMPAGSKGYFYADLKPGKYALISEVPNAKEKGLLKEFTVID
ncbi:hypothetical protein [Winogradskyella pulchriflava]|uniref:Uncharacterized protein n=1 Tax=Winogradskyella pulchriflava TaxID=1110688 RepID=A0ABV6Q7E4_9FLAO